MKVDSITDIGLVRQQNEDSVRKGMLEGAAWVTVCDGMGGANAGDIASRNAAQVIEDSINEKYTQEMSLEQIKDLLTEAVVSANTVIYNLSEEYEYLRGMGTTTVTAILKDQIVVVCHVGDSRAYLITEEEIFRLTKDHSMVQQLVDAGTITPEEARIHPRRNLITRSLGVHNTVEPEVNAFDVEPGDVILLCSDGMSNYILDEEILELAKKMAPSQLIAALVDLAKERGGSDNITVGIIEN